MSIEDRSWMYQGWNDNGCHSQEWVGNTNAFLDNAFSIGSNVEKTGVACPCLDSCNRVRQRRHVMTMHMCKREFMLGLVNHGASVLVDHQACIVKLLTS